MKNKYLVYETDDEEIYKLLDSYISTSVDCVEGTTQVFNIDQEKLDKFLSDKDNYK